MKFAPEGRPFVLLALGGIIPAVVVGGWVWALLPAALTLFVLYFFRDPQRVPPTGEGLIISPADGRVIEIRQVDDAAFPDGQAQRVSIFLSIFNVHVNRVPSPAEVASVRYSSGKFRAAFHGKASEDNERNRLDLATPFGPLAVTQIAGAIARRIVCDLAPGDRVQTGDRLGLIRFGSRVDLFLPLTAQVRIRKGDRVQSACTVMAQFNLDENGAGHAV
jgi:phosphatidylserine decarboxylase